LAAKQCYHCQGIGHVQADCPTLRLSGANRCYNCGQAGHIAVSWILLIWKLYLTRLSVTAKIPRKLSAEAALAVVVAAAALAAAASEASEADMAVFLALLRATSAAGQITMLAIARLRP
jgi:hypothetical protein